MAETVLSPDRQLGKGLGFVVLKDTNEVRQVVQAVEEYLKPVLARLSFAGEITGVAYSDHRATDREPAHESLTFTLKTGHKLRLLAGKPNSTGRIHVRGSIGFAEFQGKGKGEVWIVPEVDREVAFGSRWREQPRAWRGSIPEAYPAEGESRTIRDIFTIAKGVMANIAAKPPSAELPPSEKS